MAVKFISVKCPECGASLNIEGNRRQAFCTYCGVKIIIDNENEHIYRNIDEARVKQAETDRMIRLKEMELEEKRRKEISKQSAILIGVGFLMMVVGWVAGKASGDKNSGFYFFCMFGFIIFLWAMNMWNDINKKDDKKQK